MAAADGEAAVGVRVLSSMEIDFNSSCGSFRDFGVAVQQLVLIFKRKVRNGQENETAHAVEGGALRVVLKY